jgi:hypothetical protein
VRFKQISLEEAFTAIFRTDALMDTLTAMARGTISLQQGESRLASFKVRLVAQVPSAAVFASHWVFVGGGAASLGSEMRPGLRHGSSKGASCGRH